MSIYADETPTHAATPTRVRLRQVAALAVIAFAVLLALYGTPTAASPAEFGDALRHGNVNSMEINSSTRLGLDAVPQIRIYGSTAQSSTVVTWVGPRGWMHTTDLSALAALPAPTQQVDPNDPNAAVEPWASPATGSVDLPATLAATAGDPNTTMVFDGLGASAWRGAPLIALQVIAVLIMVSSRQPRRMTKWGWFWILQLPLGLGLAWWVLREIPWDARTELLDEPGPRERGVLTDGRLRWGGGRAWLVGFGLSTVLGLLLLPLLHLPLVPLPTPADQVTYTVVWGPQSHGEWVVGP